MADQFSALTSSTWDIIYKLRFVGKNAVTMIRVSGPVGALIAAAADIAYRPETEEFRAIKELHNFVATKFEALSRHVQHQTSEIKNFLVKSAYSEQITAALNGIERYYYKVIDPYKNRAAIKPQFIARCTDRKSPHDVLWLLKQHLFTDCSLPTDEEAESYATVLAHFQKIEEIHLQNMSIPIEEYKFIKHSLLAKSSWHYVRKELKTIALNDSTFVAQRALLKLHTQLYEAQDTCWLKVIAESNEWKRKPLLHFAELVRMDLLKASLIASHCANISFAGSPTSIEDELSEIETLLKEISEHIAEWITAKLVITWPKVSKQQAEVAIGKASIVESTAAYNSVALEIKQELDQLGEEKFFNTVIVYPNWKDDRQVAAICPAHYCLNLTDVKDINVFVVRYQDNQYERAVRASEWYSDSVKKRMTRTIIDWWMTNYTEPLAELAQKMKREVAGVADPDLYSHLVILRTWKFFRAAATITLGLTPTDILSVPTEQGFEHVIDPVTYDAETFHVHLLL